MNYTKEDIHQLYRNATSQPVVSLERFNNRLEKQKKRFDKVTEVGIKDALFLSPSKYKQKYAVRKTWVFLNGNAMDLKEIYLNFERPQISYRTFYQRIKRLEVDELLDEKSLQQAAHIPNAEWITFYGGGRRRGFVYEGDLYPHLFGQKFSSVTAFLRSIDKFDERSTVWSRLKAGWNLDDALIEPVVPLEDREGLIYLISCTETEKRYVGLTRMSKEYRWRHHLRVALENDSRTELAKAIRRYGPATFQVEVLEGELTQEDLPKREVHWIAELNTLSPNGLNMRTGGQMSSGKGKKVEYMGETFPSIEGAAAVLSDRTGIAKHVIIRRLQDGTPIPESARLMSNHPEAGTNLWRRWKSLLNGLETGKRQGNLDTDWESYDNFASDVRPGYSPELNLIQIDVNKAWGPGNFKWVTQQEAIERTHGTTYTIAGKEYPSLNAVARAFGIGRTTLKNRIHEQGLSIEEAVKMPLGPTSVSVKNAPIIVNGHSFPSMNQAAKYAAIEYGLTFDQARDRLRRGVPLEMKNMSRSKKHP